jgi:hypothetical protein
MLIALEQTKAQKCIQDNVVKASRRAFVLSEQQLKQGTVNMVTLLQLDQTLFTAEDQLAQDRLALLQGDGRPVPGPRRRLAARYAGPGRGADARGMNGPSGFQRSFVC